MRAVHEMKGDPHEGRVDDMARVGFVVDKESDGDLWVSASKRGVCENCGEASTCGMDSGHGGSENEVIRVRNALGAEVGDTVEFDLEGHTELQVSVLVWVVPLIGLLAGALVMRALMSPQPISEDLATLGGAIGGFLVAFLVVIRLDRKKANDPKLTPVVLRVLQPACKPDVLQKTMEV